MQGILTITATLKQNSSSIKNAKKKARQGRQKEKALRRQVQSMIEQAKRNIEDIRKAGLPDTPAMEKMVDRGTTLTTRNKSYNDLQSTYFSLQRFLNSQTSTAQGAIKVLEQTARIIGMENVTPEGLKSLAKDFFSTAKLVQQKLSSDKNMSYMVGSSRIFNAMRTYIRVNQEKWNKAGSDVERASMIVDKIKENLINTMQNDAIVYANEKVQYSISTSFKG